jgi:hypothetical protein
VAAKQAVYDHLLDTCVDGVASLTGADGDCSCNETDDGGADCSTAADATCADDKKRVVFGSGNASSRSVAEARAIERARARCGVFRQRADIAPSTCGCDDDGQCVCVVEASCKASAARAVP